MSNGKAFCHEPVDEALELVWMLKEEGEDASEENIRSRNLHDNIDSQLLERMVGQGYLEKRGLVFVFSEEGRKRGEEIIRRHRLAERLLVDILGMREVSVESEACRFEHILSPEVTDHICTLLGHPSTCPHGKDIPSGPCCLKAERRVETAVSPLSGLRSGEQGRILYISTAHHGRLDRLASLGLLPGRVVRVHQREPLFVIMLDETQLALERKIVDEIFVLRS